VESGRVPGLIEAKQKEDVQKRKEYAKGLLILMSKEAIYIEF